MKEYDCELSKTGKCKYGGSKRFNYGFARGALSWCYYPGVDRAVFPMIGKELECPLLKEGNQ